ncbi:hypothetical protein HVV52_10685 [Escherichia fergusonii]|uniref:imm11 family protein n=1 Tax=Escherichia fergusonii TaxID=564 RepID=UPI0015E51403|nr:DUF1629 domain-containing protein [Escherichia fergusonii]QLM08184.1 hypothetical protein HVV50_10675 [Escherichia fergusonii]QLM12777.1 hypothetical protein HVV51_10685 [Escherichia fergusonii]QLM17373.1 hypothetical protein HVV52_10685 [Escherichia fergusonii]QMQ70681.1 hypothetical protein HVV54_10680 [Escherichia fergusonii]WFV01401.1 hypothetical protein NFJ18_10720 [Escherichia fergusonii]
MYRWTIPEQYANKYIGEYQYESFDYLLFSHGKPIERVENINPVIIYTMPDEMINKYDCLPNSSLIPVVNERLKDFLETHAKGNVAFHKIDLQTNNGLKDGFYLLNTLTKLPLIDMQHSHYQYIPGTTALMGFEQVFFIEEPPEDFCIARCAEYSSYLMLSDSLVKKMKKEKFKGISYSKVPVHRG